MQAHTMYADSSYNEVRRRENLLMCRASKLACLLTDLSRSLWACLSCYRGGQGLQRISMYPCCEDMVPASQKEPSHLTLLLALKTAQGPADAATLAIVKLSWDTRSLIAFWYGMPKACVARSREERLLQHAFIRWSWVLK